MVEEIKYPDLLNPGSTDLSLLNSTQFDAIPVSSHSICENIITEWEHPEIPMLYWLEDHENGSTKNQELAKQIDTLEDEWTLQRKHIQKLERQRTKDRDEIAALKRKIGNMYPFGDTAKAWVE